MITKLRHETNFMIILISSRLTPIGILVLLTFLPGTLMDPKIRTVEKYYFCEKFQKQKQS